MRSSARKRNAETAAGAKVILQSNCDGDRNSRKRKKTPQIMAEKITIHDALMKNIESSRADNARKLLKREQRETPPRLSPAVDEPADDPRAAPDAKENSNSQTDKSAAVQLPRNADDGDELLQDRKDEIQRMLARIREQEMPQLDNECQNAACGQDNGTDPESTATSSVHSDDTPPRLTVAQVSSSFSSSPLDGEENRGEYCDDNASPPPLDKYALSAPSPVPGTKAKDPSSWSLRLRRRPFQTALLSAASGVVARAALAGPSNKKGCTETDWANRLAEVLGELNPTQLMLAKETVYSTMVKVLAQEITTDISLLMSLIESRDRRAAAFEKVLKDLKKLKSDCAYDSSL